MKLNLTRLMGRTMATGAVVGATSRPRRGGSVRLQLMLVAGILAIVTGVSGLVYYMLRPATLRVAVGPATSDDLKVISALSQALLRERA